MSSDKPVLMSIIEIGGYPDFTSLYEDFGFQVVQTNTVRKAVKLIRQHKPKVMVAEFNFQSDFRDRTSSLESLLSTIQRLDNCEVIVFYEKEYAHQLEKLTVQYSMHTMLPFPIEEDELKNALRAILQG